MLASTGVVFVFLTFFACTHAGYEVVTVSYDEAHARLLGSVHGPNSCPHQWLENQQSVQMHLERIVCLRSNIRTCRSATSSSLCAASIAAGAFWTLSPNTGLLINLELFASSGPKKCSNEHEVAKFFQNQKVNHIIRGW
jgi:hypothetical protein